MYNASNIGNTHDVLVENLGEKRYFKRPQGKARTIFKTDFTEGR
jgi:hypothetical protein